MAIININDVVRVKFSESEYSEGVILFYDSKKEIVLLGIIDSRVNNPSYTDKDIESLIYTYSDAILDDDWEVVGRAQVMNPENYSKRTVGGTVWEGKKKVTDISQDESENYPEMGISGTGAAEKYMYFLKYGGEEKAFFRMNSREMKVFLDYLKQK